MISASIKLGFDHIFSADKIENTATKNDLESSSISLNQNFQLRSSLENVCKCPPFIVFWPWNSRNNFSIYCFCKTKKKKVVGSTPCKP